MLEHFAVDTDSRIMLRRSALYKVGQAMTAVGLAAFVVGILIGLGVVSPSKELIGELGRGSLATVSFVTGAAALLSGLSTLGRSTEIRLDEPRDHFTMTHWRMPLVGKPWKIVQVSKTEAATVYVRSYRRAAGQQAPSVAYPAYDVALTPADGSEELHLYGPFGQQESAEHLAQRIADWAES